MNEETINAANALLLKLIEGVSKGADFVSAEAPELIQQLLLFKLIESSVVVIILVLFFGLVIWLNYKQYKWWNKPTYEGSSCRNWDCDNTYAIFNLLQLTLFAPFMIMYEHTINAIKIVVAPKLYLLEYAASLIK